jgi:hypothetical protein
MPRTCCAFLWAQQAFKRTMMPARTLTIRTRARDVRAQVRASSEAASAPPPPSSPQRFALFDSDRRPFNPIYFRALNQSHIIHFSKLLSQFVLLALGTFSVASPLDVKANTKCCHIDGSLDVLLRMR